MIDLIRLAFSAVWSHRLRSALSMLGIAIGVGAVILLTSVGEGTRRFIVAQFNQFGTNLIAINPGKSQTMGVPGALGGTTHKLTLSDAESLERLPGVTGVAPVAFGSARVEVGTRARSVIVYGVTPSIKEVWRFNTRLGSFWSEGQVRRSQANTVLGPKLAKELFESENPLGRWVRIGGRRYRVVGVMEPKGQFLGFDLDDTVYLPVASAMSLLNLDELQEIDVLYANSRITKSVEEAVRVRLMERHGNTEDFAITSQEAMLSVFGNIMSVITVAVGAIAGVSLLVGAVGILTMMWIAVGERTGEIGLLRAIGATRRQVQNIFLIEAGALALLGGILGLVGSLGLLALVRVFVPGLPVSTPPLFIGAALLTSLVTGLLSGFLPARRAANLDPIEALHDE